MLRLRRLRIAALALATVAGGAPSAAAPAQSPQAMQIVDAVGMRSLAPLRPVASFSPRGQWLAYTACDPRRVQMRSDGKARTDATRVTAGCSIWIRPYDAKSSHRDGLAFVIAHEGAAWAPSWSPDGTQIAFYGEDPDGIHLWIWNSETRKSRQIGAALVNVNVGREVPLWSAGGERIFTKVMPALAAPTANSASTDPSTGENGATVVVSQSGPNPAPEVPPIYRAVDLAAIDVATGEVTRLATDRRMGEYWLSPDRRWLSFASNAGGVAKDRFSYKWNLELVDLTTGQARTLAAFDQAHGVSVRWAPDSRSLAYFSGPMPESHASCWVISIDGGEPRRLAGAANFGTLAWHLPLWDSTSTFVYSVDQHTLWRGDVRTNTFTAVATWPERELLSIMTSSEGGAAWSMDSGATLYIETRDRRTRRGELMQVDVASGVARVLRDESLSIGVRGSSPVVSPSGQFLAYVAQSAQRAPDLWLTSIDLTRRQQLTVLNPEFGAYPVGASRLLEYRGADGTPLKAALLLPAGYTPGKRYPMVAWVYGSKMGSDNVHQFGLYSMNAFNLQMLATRGYAVLFPDIPLTPGAHVRSLMDTVMPAIDEAIALGIADPQRLAVMGQSAGGYATLALVTQTHRFKAAIVCAGFGELASFYGHGWSAWLETGDGAIGAAPWESPQRYVENSPLFYLDRIRTPLLIQAGDQDEAVGEFPKHIYTSLQRLGKDATYLRYRGEGHVLKAHANLVDFWNRVDAFLQSELAN